MKERVGGKWKGVTGTPPLSPAAIWRYTSTPAARCFTLGADLSSPRCSSPVARRQKILKFPARLEQKKASDSESGPVWPACVVPQCAKTNQKQARRSGARSHLAAARCSTVFHLKPLKPDVQNHHFGVFATSKKQRKQSGKEAPAGRGRGRGPHPGFRVRVPQCSSLELRRIGEDAISISDRSISIQFGDPYLHNLEGPALRRCPRAFASNVRMETNLQILGEL